jgi:uncharacterized protein YggT (Ycf19 family)
MTWRIPARSRHPHGRTLYSLTRPYIGPASVELPLC